MFDRLKALGIFTLCVAPLAAACGDDTTATGGAGAGGGAGGTGATGGSGDGGVLVTVTSTSTGMVEMSVIGEPCVDDEPCGDGFCIVEDLNGWPAGYCSAECQGDDDCGTETCLVNAGVCGKRCDGPRDCRDAYDCVDTGLGPEPVCFPACTSNDQCTEPRECITDPESDNPFGFCVWLELCDDSLDNDGDGYPDCADSECLADATCAAAIDAACSAPPAVESPETGDTGDGTNLFAMQCGNVLTGGGSEVLYSFTAPSLGELALSAVPGAGADLALYVRADCGDPTTVLGCADDPQDSAATEEVAVGLQAGQTVTIFVDAWTLGTDGPYTLDAAFTPAVCGDGLLTLPETCEDGNTTAGDGCSDLCAVELDFYCGAATPIGLGTTAGTTVGGTSLFSAPVDAEDCTYGAGPGPEVLYLYTPASTGTLTITLEPDGNDDLGLHARTDCDDGATQIGCADVNFQSGMQDETLTLQVTEAVPVTIFVDAYGATGGPFSVTLSQN
jgi:cysteine-rich repeat protein